MRICIAASCLFAATTAFAAPATSVESVSSPDTVIAPPLSITLGFGAGYLGGKDASQGASFRLGVAYWFTDKVALSFDSSYVSFARYQADPTLSRQVGTNTLGLRYRPFGAPSSETGLDLTNFQLRAGVGVAHEIRTPYATLNPFSIQQGEWAPAVEASIAWLALRGPGWEAGIELQASYARFEEPQQSYSALLVFNLELGAPAPRRNPGTSQVASK